MRVALGPEAAGREPDPALPLPVLVAGWLREAVGDNPADWFPALTGHAWPGGTAIEDAGTGVEAFKLAAE